VRVLALDIGEKRVGVAVSDGSARVASALTVLEARSVQGDCRELRRLLEDYDDVELIIIGLPMTLEGGEGPQATRVRQVGTRVAECTGLPIAYADERLTSAEAHRRMAETGADSRARRGSVDMVAASIMLQAYLDGSRGEA
jgi:putative holliday junction resolvase